MEIYLQEVEAATFLSDQPLWVREKVYKVASVFLDLLQNLSLAS